LAEEEKSTSQQLEELMNQAEPMIDQINNLYKMYSTGVERLPPLQKRQQLDSIVTRMGTLPKATQSQRFRFSSFVSRYNTMKDRWERLLKEVESGKIKPLIPRRGRNN
jgi:hypothetical protein